MQTFLPYPDFVRSARCLDSRRLGKQRVEAMQILRVLRGEKEGWKNHPAVRMWRGHEDALALYFNTCRAEWIARGFKNTMPELPHRPAALPAWLSDTFCAAHRSNLLRKDPAYYAVFGWVEGPDLEYVWPV